MLKEGDNAPDFQAAADDGRTVSLVRLSRQSLRAVLFPQSQHARLNQRSVRVSRRNEGFQESQTAVVGCSADSVEAQAKFKAKYNLNFPLLSDPDFQSDRSVWRPPHEALPREILPGHRAHDLLDRHGRQDSQDLGQGLRAKVTPTKCSPPLRTRDNTRIQVLDRNG